MSLEKLRAAGWRFVYRSGQATVFAVDPETGGEWAKCHLIRNLSELPQNEMGRIIVDLLNGEPDPRITAEEELLESCFSALMGIAGTGKIDHERLQELHVRLLQHGCGPK